MRKPIEDYTDKGSLRIMLENAERLGDNDISHRIIRRLCVLEGLDQPDPLHRDFYQTLAAYELQLTRKNGRTTKASRTRQKLKNKSVIECLEDWAISTAPTEGFELLVAQGLTEFTGEYLVLKYPAKFSLKAVAAAKRRLKDVGATTFPAEH